jgi:hypothetical protein
MSNWIHTISEDELRTLWAGLALDLIAEHLKSDPKDLTDEELQKLGHDLTVKYQEEKGDGYDHSDLVNKYGTPEMQDSYKEFISSL